MRSCCISEWAATLLFELMSSWTGGLHDQRQCTMRSLHIYVSCTLSCVLCPAGPALQHVRGWVTTGAIQHAAIPVACLLYCCEWVITEHGLVSCNMFCADSKHQHQASYLYALASRPAYAGSFPAAKCATAELKTGLPEQPTLAGLSPSCPTCCRLASVHHLKSIIPAGSLAQQAAEQSHPEGLHTPTCSCMTIVTVCHSWPSLSRGPAHFVMNAGAAKQVLRRPRAQIGEQLPVCLSAETQGGSTDAAS